MKNKLLYSAILLAFTSTAVSAATVNVRHEYKPKFGEQGASNVDRVAVSHRFKNGIGFEVEAKWKSNVKTGKTNAAPLDFDQMSGNGQQANISYAYKLSDSFTLTPQYKWESNDSKFGQQFNLTLGYKVNSDWNVSFRQRYHYETRPNNDKSSHYNRWTFGAGYRGLESWNLGASVDYTFKQDGQVVYKDKDAYFSEVNFTFEYTQLESGFRPFGEIGFNPSRKDTREVDAWRPMFRVGVKYSF
ncbi:oligogalacturonate-specific porin KdgM family protein [Vibrio metschnikovii]|uniref:Porin n=1 Tax=Vibrio metschnikovii TaxID=28172 RepID=A0A9X0UGX1_VIBME|nr:oligogalacturonate-specific porin KdgM family protein [Vibrio metschnikovii]EKO3677545.1 porin [Vibrio metschnikovii]MBC5850427.1 porin [Vibrio metschnikovii]MDA3138614.1 porin [Vibrio metschnikovii]